MSGLRATSLRGRTSGSSPTFPDGAVVTGVTTSTSFSGDLIGNVTGNATTATTATTATNAQGLTGTPNVVVGSVTGATGTFSGNVSIGGTLTYEDVTNIDSVGLITARSGIDVTSGNTSIKGAVETVTTGAYAGTELTCDTTTGTVFTHDLQAGLVNSIKISNFPATASSFHTVTIILTQNDAGTGHTTAPTGIGTNITLDPAGVTGFSTVARVGSGTTVTLGTIANDDNFVTFGVHYNGGTNTDASNYKTYVTKSGDYRFG